MSSSHARARRRDRRVYLRSHPVLFAALSAARRRPVLRLGSSVVVNDATAFRDVLTRLPLDRVAAGTTGGMARAQGPDSLLFDQDGPAHRQARRRLTEHLGAAGVARLRPVWLAVLDRRLAALGSGRPVDVVGVVAEMAGASTAALLGSAADPAELAAAARDSAADAIRQHLPGLRRRLRRRPGAAARLAALLPGDRDCGQRMMLAVAAINTTVAGIPRAVAWCADAGLWGDAASDHRRQILVPELFRVVAPTPLLPRAAAADGSVAGRSVRRGDRLLLVARHAGLAHRRDPDCADPVPSQRSRLVFGAGAHSCPGAELARAQLDDVLRLLAPHRPRVVAARADRHAALPGWATLTLQATR
jgi:cytochrome P450